MGESNALVWLVLAGGTVLFAAIKFSQVFDINAMVFFSGVN